MARPRQNSSVALPHGRKRTISPGFFTDATLLSLPPIERIFFEGLWVYADREGRLLDAPIDLKIRIVPMDVLDPEATLAKLAEVGLILRYRVRGIRFIALKSRGWSLQRIHPEEAHSQIPPPPKAAFWTSREESEETSDDYEGVSDNGNDAVDQPIQPGSSGSSGSSGRMSPVPDHANGGDSSERSDGSSPTPIESGFFRWAQLERVSRKLPADRVPQRPTKLAAFRKKLSAWWAEVLTVPDGERRAQSAYLSYLDDPFWGRDRRPPWPFAGFLSQWEENLPAYEPPAPTPPEPPPLVAELERRLAPLRAAGHAYAASQLRQLEPVALAGDVLQLRPSDQYFAAWCSDHYGEHLTSARLELLPVELMTSGDQESP